MEWTRSGWVFVTLAVVIAGAVFIGWGWSKYGTLQDALRALKESIKGATKKVR